MNRLLVLPIPMLAAAPAWAEVCDKVAGESWRPEHGPISWKPLQPAPDWAAVEGWKIVAFALVLSLAAAARTRGLALIGAVVLLAASAHSAVVWGLYREDEPGIIAAAIREGCLPPSLLAGGAAGPSIGLPLAWAAAAVFALYPRGLRHAA